MIKTINLLSFVLIVFSQVGWTQTYLPGETYYGDNDYIEYKAGNLPIIISAPHGGSLEPNTIPNRNCSGCVYVKDSFTEELIREMYDAIYEELGCYPHVVINRLHRRKLDANRAIGDAADGNSSGEQAWTDFHHFIDSAKDTVNTNFGKGLYLDLHGHGHDIQRLELGYLLSKSELQLDNSTLNEMSYVDDASIKNLVYNNANEFELSTLIRGENSFGELYEEENYPAVPSQTDPYPENADSYFSGGYNTQRHGSQAEGTIDGIQIECNMDGVRNNGSNRAAFAAATARTIRTYLEQHYFGDDFFDGDCTFITNVDAEERFKESSIKVFPNPVGDYLTVDCKTCESDDYFISLINELGQVIFNDYYTNDNVQISTQHLPKGIYVLHLRSNEQVYVQKFVK